MENNFKRVNDNIFSDGACRVESLNLRETYLQTTHLISVFSKIRKNSEIKVRSLALSGNLLPISNEETVAEAVCKLEKADLVDTHLSKNQVASIFSYIRESNKINLKLLKINDKFKGLEKIHLDQVLRSVKIIFSPRRADTDIFETEDLYDSDEYEEYDDSSSSELSDDSDSDDSDDDDYYHDHDQYRNSLNNFSGDSEDTEDSDNPDQENPLSIFQALKVLMS